MPRTRTTSAPGMRRPARVTAILRLLADGDTFDVDRLAKELGVSTATVRRDLRLLDEQKLLVRVRGGAKACPIPVCEIPVRYRDVQDRGAKRAIARAALRFVPLGAPQVAISGGTTTEELARLLATRSGLTVITNALNIADVLIGRPQVNLIVTGGTARSRSSQLVGPMAARSFGGVDLDAVFVGVDGIDAAGLWTHDVAAAHVSALMIERARRVVVLADGSKLGRRCPAHIVSLAAVHVLVTDPSANRAVLGRLASEGMNIRVVTAPIETEKR